MSGATVTKLPPRLEKIQSGSRIRMTPAMAQQLLESNQLNRPLAPGHAERIAGQIKAGKWRFNGDTIKISKTGDVLDGQHRLWAIIESDTPVDTIVIFGIDRDAFATIDTIRKPRSLGDTVALAGQAKYRSVIGAALSWHIRWRKGFIETYRAPKNRIENSDIEVALADHPGIVRAVERAQSVRRVANVALVAFLYYVVVNRNEELAERMISTLADPAGVSVNDPFYLLRQFFLADHHKKKDPVVTIAIAIKAINAAASNRRIQVLNWRHQGKSPETFPDLDI